MRCVKETKLTCVQKEDEASQLSLPPKLEFQTHDFTWPVPLTAGTTV